MKSVAAFHFLRHEYMTLEYLVVKLRPVSIATSLNWILVLSMDIILALRLQDLSFAIGNQQTQMPSTIAPLPGFMNTLHIYRLVTYLLDVVSVMVNLHLVHHLLLH